MKRGIGTDYVVTTGGRLHRLVVEKALGHAIPPKAHVHHVNGNKQDAGRGNLVLCEDSAYHMLLHLRQRALDACGDANRRMCTHCKVWDDPTNLGFGKRRKSGQPYHRSCAATYQANLRKKRVA